MLTAKNNLPMKRQILTVLFLACAGFLLAGPPRYAADDIPAQLKEHANAVYREQKIHVVLDEDGSASMEATEVITVLNENGEEAAMFIKPYDGFFKYKKIRARIYDEYGREQEKIRRGDILDVAWVSSYSLYEDTRYKVIDPEYHSYPYTVEYTYEVKHDEIMNYPDFIITPGYNVAMEHSSYTIDFPDNRKVRYYSQNLEGVEPEESRVDGLNRLHWEVEHHPAIRNESYSRGFREIASVVWIAPGNFYYGGHEGSLESWQAFGEWISSLNEGKQHLEPEVVDQVKEVVEGVTDKREIVETLYTWMQDRVRYVNIKLGIGGFSPIPAQRVHEVGYGDCKALSNYMKALLNAAGVRSVYTIVGAGSDYPKMREEFPSLQFNHAILMVPLENDSIWLECTSQRLPAGYTGDFTDDRPVLLVTEDGGKLARTPAYSCRDNVISLEAEVTLDPRFHGKASTVRQYRGVHFGNMMSRYYFMDDTERKRFVQKKVKLSDFRIEEFSFEIRMEDRMVKEECRIDFRNMVSARGELVMLPLHLFTNELRMPERTRDRSLDFYVRRGYVDQCTVRYHLPPGFEVQSLPEKAELESEYGAFTMKTTLEEGKLVLHRKLQVYPGDYPVAQYGEFYDFFREIDRADHRSVVLSRTKP